MVLLCTKHDSIYLLYLGQLIISQRAASWKAWQGFCQLDVIQPCFIKETVILEISYKLKREREIDALFAKLHSLPSFFIEEKKLYIIYDNKFLSIEILLKKIRHGLAKNFQIYKSKFATCRRLRNGYFPQIVNAECSSHSMQI